MKASHVVLSHFLLQGSFQVALQQRHRLVVRVLHHHRRLDKDQPKQTENARERVHWCQGVDRKQLCIYMYPHTLEQGAHG